MESASNADGTIAVGIAKQKDLSAAVFNSLGMPTPKGILVNSIDALQQAVSGLGYPCVIKPLNRGGGKGVTANIKDYAQLVRAFAAARVFSDGPLRMEQFIEGDEHRLMVVDGKFVAAIRREPSHIRGNGINSIRQLVDDLNSTRSANMVKSAYLRPIAFDDIVLGHLALQNLHLDDVLEKGRKVFLRSNSNLSTGGIGIEVSAQLHPLLKKMVEQLSNSVGLGAAGIDYITTDIAATPWDSGGSFIEMNSTPGLEAAVAAGWSAEKIGSVVLGETVGRIPVIIHVMSAVPAKIGTGAFNANNVPGTAIVFGNEIHSGEAIFKIQNAHPWAAVYGALRNKSVNALEIYCSIADIINFGLPVDRVDRITIEGVEVPAEWQGVLADHSAAVETLK